MKKTTKFIALAAITMTVTTCYGPGPDFQTNEINDIGYKQPVNSTSQVISANNISDNYDMVKDGAEKLGEQE